MTDKRLYKVSHVDLGPEVRVYEGAGGDIKCGIIYISGGGFVSIIGSWNKWQTPIDLAKGEHGWVSV